MNLKWEMNKRKEKLIHINSDKIINNKDIL